MVQFRPSVTLRLKERHPIEVERPNLPGRKEIQGYIAIWKQLGRDGKVCGLVRLDSDRHPPHGRIRHRTINGVDVGIYRIVKEEGRWYIEIFEEADP